MWAGALAEISIVCVRLCVCVCVLVGMSVTLQSLRSTG